MGPDMIENLVKIQLPPGLFRNGTKYEAAGRWYDGNLMRWVEGYPQPIGGWRRAQNISGGDLSALTGVPRAALAWRSASGTPQLAVGTHSKLYVLVAGVVSNITPSTLVAGDQNSEFVGGTYGAGLYGVGVYGTGSGALVLDEADTWQLDTFGDYLVGVLTDDGKLWVWEGDTSVIASLATGAPTFCRGVVVTPERFLVALGAGGDGRKVQWAEQESTTEWLATDTNQAGDFTLQTSGRIMCGRRTRQQTLIWTDVDVHTMTYIGGDFIYSFALAGDNCGIIAPNAVATESTRAFWMGQNSFYLYDGYVQPLPCEVHDHVFENFNRVAAAKVVAQTLAEFGEVWWFYPSAQSSENDRYVVYNYKENYWHFGQLARTAGVDRGAVSTPMMIGSDGFIYEHEIAESRGTEVPYLESGPLELDSGDRVVRIQRIVPDGAVLSDAQMYLYAAFYPTETEVKHGPYLLSNPTDTRITTRQVRVRIEEVNGVSWRVGVPRLGVILGGRR